MNQHAQLAEAVGGLPDSYLIVDVETNGMAIKDQLILPTQLGYLLAVGREQVDCGAIVVNWARVLPRHLQAAFWEKARRTEQNMRERGRECKVTTARIRDEGADPHEAWAAYREMIMTAQANGIGIAGHNIYAFDCPLLERVGLQMESPLEFQALQLLDFGLFEKALSAGLEFPHTDKGPLDQWYRYVRSAFSKGKWSLTHCLEKYRLIVTHELASIGAHDAAYDCVACHLLVEAYRALAEERCPYPSPGSSTPMKSAS